MACRCAHYPPAYKVRLSNFIRLYIEAWAGRYGF